MGNQYNRKHGFAGNNIERLFKVWIAMKQRCLNPNDRSYKNYGGRGITVCKSWTHDYEAFRSWCYANGYVDGGKLSLDRINNDKGYSPNNCRFSTRLVQNRNKRQKQRLLTARGVTKPMSEWAKDLGLSNTSIIRGRLNIGWDEERAVLYPVSAQGAAPKKTKLAY
jgi:hypothetical protein